MLPGLQEWHGGVGALQNDLWGPNINREKPEAGAGGAWDYLSTQESHTESLGLAGAEKPNEHHLMASLTLLHQHLKIWNGPCQPSPEL